MRGLCVTHTHTTLLVEEKADGIASNSMLYACGWLSRNVEWMVEISHTCSLAYNYDDVIIQEDVCLYMLGDKSPQ